MVDLPPDFVRARYWLRDSPVRRELRSGLMRSVTLVISPAPRSPRNARRASFTIATPRKNTPSAMRKTPIPLVKPGFAFGFDFDQLVWTRIVMTAPCRVVARGAAFRRRISRRDSLSAELSALQRALAMQQDPFGVLFQAGAAERQQQPTDLRGARRTDAPRPAA